MKQSGTIVVVIAAALLLLSLAFLGRVLCSRHGQPLNAPGEVTVISESPPGGELQVSPAPAEGATGAPPPASLEAPSAGAAVAPSTPVPGATRRSARNTSGNLVPGTTGPSPGALGGAFPGAGQRRWGGAGSFQRPSGGAQGQPSTSRPAGGTPPAGRQLGPQRATTTSPTTPDPRLAEWARDLREVRDTIDNAKVALREHNQDQVIEILDQALAQLPDTSAAATVSRPAGAQPLPAGGGLAPGPTTAPASADLLSLGQRVQDLLYQELDFIRSLPEGQYREERTQIVIGLLAELLMTSRGATPALSPGPGARPRGGFPAGGPGGRPGRPSPPAPGTAPAAP